MKPDSTLPPGGILTTIPRPAEVRADLARVAREARLLRSLLRLSARAISEHDRPELEAARR